MSLYGNRYYEPDDTYADAEIEEEAIESYAQELLQASCNPATHWGEGLSECGYDEMDYPTPSHAPLDIVHRVNAYWYNTALFIARKYYEGNPL